MFALSFEKSPIGFSGRQAKIFRDRLLVGCYLLFVGQISPDE